MINKNKNNHNDTSQNRRNFLKITSIIPLFINSCKDRGYKIEKDPIYNELPKSSLYKSICPLCNIGCKININITSNKNNIKKINSINPTNNPDYYLSGILCIKGITVNQTLFNNRLSNPIIDKDVYEKFKEWKNAGDDINLKYNEVDKNIKNLRDNTLGFNSQKKENREFINISIQEAIEIIKSKTIYTIQKNSPDEIYSYSSSSLGIETHYAINKFIRGLLSSPNIDTDIRIRDYSTDKALKDTTGSYITNSIFKDIYLSDLVIMSGTNLRSSSPVFFWKYINHIKSNNLTSIYFDPRETSTIIENKELRLSNKNYDEKKYGFSSAVTNGNSTLSGNIYHLSLINTDMYAVNSIAYNIITKYTEALDENFINNFTSNYNDYKQYILDNFSPEKTKPIHKIEDELLDLCTQEIVQASIKSRNRGIGGVLWLTGSGLSENFYGYESMRSIISLLSITGNLYRKGSGILPLNNIGNSYAQYISGNNSDVLLSGIEINEILEDDRFSYWSFTKGYNNKPYQEIISSIWNVHKDDLNSTIKKKSKNFIDAFLHGNNSLGSTIFLFNPKLSLIPSYNLIKNGFNKSFTILFDQYHDSANKQFADLVLPYGSFGEIDESGINIDRNINLKPKILNTSLKNHSITEYLYKISNDIKKYLNISNFKISSENNNINENLYNELLELTRGTEFELPSDLYKTPEMNYRIPYRRTYSDEYRFMFIDNRDRRRFYKGYRTSNGKINLFVNKKNEKSVNNNKNNLEDLSIYINKLNYSSDNIIHDNNLLKVIKNEQILVKSIQDEFINNSVSDIKNNDKYPLWLICGSVYEHYLTDITSRSSLISDWINEPYIEVNEGIINMYNLNEGEKVYIKTPIGKIIASISKFKGKIRPGRNIVPDNVIYAPYNILYDFSVNMVNKTYITDIIKPIIEPITGSCIWKSPCRIEYL